MELAEYILSILGIIAYAISGAEVAIKKGMDIFGVAILGLTTSIGGGLIRDALLGVHPPVMLISFEMPLIAVGISLIYFIPVIRKGFLKATFLSHSLVLLFDSIGLGVFTVVGVQACYSAGFGKQYFLQIFVGVMTACGGGVLRDVMANDLPYIFVRHFYASASLIGSIVCVLLWNLTLPVIGIIAGALVTIVLRLLAAHFRWKLPRAKPEETET